MTLHMSGVKIGLNVGYMPGVSLASPRLKVQNVAQQKRKKKHVLTECVTVLYQVSTFVLVSE